MLACLLRSGPGLWKKGATSTRKDRRRTGLDRCKGRNVLRTTSRLQHRRAGAPRRPERPWECTTCSCSSHPDGCGGRGKLGPTSTATRTYPTPPTQPYPASGHFLLSQPKHSIQRAKFPCQAHLTPCASAQSATSLQGQGGKDDKSPRGETPDPAFPQAVA